MRDICRRFLSFLLILVIFSSALPVYADSEDSEYTQKVNFWHWLSGDNKVLRGVVGFMGGNICPDTEDGYHRSSSYQKDGNDGYYTCICDYCGKQFIAHVSDLQQSYETQVEELPAQSFNSDGSLLWSPLSRDVYASYTSPSPWSKYYYSGCSHFELPSNATNNASFVLIADCEKLTVIVRPCSGVSSFNVSSVSFRFADVYPIDGYYTLLNKPSAQGYYIDSSGNKQEFNKTYSAGSSVFMEARKEYSYSSSISPDGVNAHYDPYSLLSVRAYAPVYKVAPFDSLIGEINSTYNINTRPTSITGNYGIIGDNGQITQVTDNSSIVNETTNQFFNPATGESTTITDWSYNYEDRSYTVTTETGDTVTVTYGDENITIVQGGDTYNIYYMVPGSGSDSPGPETCAHNWQETDKTDPTCVTAGKTVSTCSLCGKTKTDPIPAAGHTWVVDRIVQTVYDDDGNLLQQGYTIYQCSVCGEQYKDQQGIGPPGEEEEKSLWEKLGDLIGSGIGGILELIEAVLGKILDALTSLGEMITDKLKGIVEGILAIFDELPALFGGFLDFLSALFPYLPEEIMLLLTFGIATVVFIGILKAVRR